MGFLKFAAQVRCRSGRRPIALRARAAAAPALLFCHGFAAFKVARRRLALCKLFEKSLTKNFYFCSTAPYTIRNSGWLYSTTWPLPKQISATVPSTSAGISFISFMASMMHRVSPFFTWSPTSTKGLLSGLAAA